MPIKLGDKAVVQRDIRTIPALEMRFKALRFAEYLSQRIIEALIHRSPRIDRINRQKRAMVSIGQIRVKLQGVHAFCGGMVMQAWVAARGHILKGLVAG